MKMMILNMQDVLNKAVRETVTKCITEITESAKTDLVSKLNSEADKIALSILSHYLISENGNRIVIEVKKHA